MKVLVVLIFSLTLSLTAFAGKSEKYAWIDMQKAIMKVKEGKRILKNLETEAGNNQKEFQEELQGFQKMKQEFDKKSLVMNEKTRTKKQEELQAAYIKLQQKDVQMKQEFQRKHALNMDWMTRRRLISSKKGKSKSPKHMSPCFWKASPVSIYRCTTGRLFME